MVASADDIALAQRLLAGDDAAWYVLYDRVQSASGAFGHNRRRYDQDDVVQDALQRLLQRLEPLLRPVAEGQVPLMALLFNLLRDARIDLQRRHGAARRDTGRSHGLEAVSECACPVDGELRACSMQAWLAAEHSPDWPALTRTIMTMPGPARLLLLLDERLAALRFVRCLCQASLVEPPVEPWTTACGLVAWPPALGEQTWEASSLEALAAALRDDDAWPPSAARVADMLGVGRNTVDQWRSRGRHRLREMVRDRDWLAHWGGSS